MADQLDLAAPQRAAFAERMRQLENALQDLAAKLPALAREVAELRRMSEERDA